MRKRRVLRKLKINEISGVNRPAQEGAVAVIMKRQEDDIPAKLRALRERRDGAQDELAELEGLREDKEEMNNIETEIKDLQAAITQRRQELAMNKSGNGPAEIRKSAEGLMDAYAESIRKSSETFAAAYVRACGTEVGRDILQTIDDAYRTQVGEPTSHDLQKLAAS